MLGRTFFHIGGKAWQIVKDMQNMNSGSLKQCQKIKQTSRKSKKSEREFYGEKLLPLNQGQPVSLVFPRLLSAAVVMSAAKGVAFFIPFRSLCGP